MVKNVNIIREVRKSKGLTLEQLAQMTGYSMSTLEKVEKCQRRLKGYFLDEVANALDVEPEYLANGQNVDSDARVVESNNNFVEKRRKYMSLNEPNTPTYSALSKIKHYRNNGLRVPKNQIPNDIIGHAMLFKDTNSFAITLPSVDEKIEFAVPWIEPGAILYCSKSVPLKKGKLVVISCADFFEVGVIEAIKNNDVSVNCMSADAKVCPSEDVFVVTAIDL